MHRRGMLAVLVGVLALAGAILVVVSVASARPNHRGVKQGDTIVAQLTEQLHTEATPGSPGTSLGDLYVFSGPLNDPAGSRLDGHCVVTSAPGGGEDRQQCFATTTIQTGEQEIQMTGVGRVAADDVLMSITGGTHAYCGARGEALFDFRTPDTIRVTFVRLNKNC